MIQKLRGRDYKKLSIHQPQINHSHKNSSELNRDGSYLLILSKQEPRKLHKIPCPPDTVMNDDHILISAVLIKLIFHSLQSYLSFVLIYCLHFVDFTWIRVVSVMAHHIHRLLLFYIFYVLLS